MAIQGGIGSGVVVTLSVDTTIARVRSATLPEWITEAVDFTGLSDLDWMKSKPGGPMDPGTANVELFMDSTLAPPTSKVIQVITFTFPIQTAGNATQATLSGSGFALNVNWGNASINEALMQGFTFKFDGDTAPAFSLEDL